MARDLCYGGGDSLMQHEIIVFEEEAAHAPKIDRWEEILKVKIQDITPITVLVGIGDDGTLGAKPV